MFLRGESAAELLKGEHKISIVFSQRFTPALYQHNCLQVSHLFSSRSLRGGKKGFESNVYIRAQHYNPEHK